jgi:hypothetical protein
MLGIDLEDHLVQDRVPALPDPLVQLPADLRGPLRPGKARQQHAHLGARAALRRARGHRVCPVGIMTHGSAGLMLQPVVWVGKLVV